MIFLKKILFNLLFFSFIFIAPANAYIDPGSGSFILQAILAVGASIAVYLKNPIIMIKSFFKSNKKKDKLDNKEENNKEENNKEENK